MRVTRAKGLIGMSVLAAGAVLLVLVLSALGVLQVRSSRGASPASALTEVPEGAVALQGMVRWEPDGPLQGRAVEPATRRAVEAAWTRALEAQQLASAGDASHLSTWFAGPALVQARRALQAERVQVTLARHPLRITFYSDDGAVVGLHAGPVPVTRTVVVDGVRTALPDVEAYEVVLLLEDGNWRVRQWQRTVPISR